MEARVPEPVEGSLGELFFDGTNYYRVVAPLPARFPLAGSKGPNGGTFGYVVVFGLYVVLGGFLLLMLDRRWKVVVLRRSPERLKRWRAISVDFVSTSEEAIGRGCALLADWDPEEAALAAPISWQELRRLRKVSLDRSR